jgi:lactate permease
VLTVVAMGSVAIGPVEEVLAEPEVGIGFPAVETGYDLETEAEDPYNAFEPLVHPGAFLLAAAGAAWLLYRSRGYYGAWADQAGRDEVEHDVEPIGAGVVGDAVPASLAVVGFLVLSQLMAHSGQTDVLALGISEVAPAGVYAFFAGWVGLLGSFMTSSNTASNIIFAPLQQTLAEAEGLTEAGVLSGQHAGAAVGNAISPANAVLGTGAAGIVGSEGEVLRKVMPYALVSVITVGVGTVLFTW